MTTILNIPKIARIAIRYTLAALIVWFLVSRGMHPAWAIIILIFRRAIFKITVALGLLYWLTCAII